jgi:hypothetical protein
LRPRSKRRRPPSSSFGATIAAGFAIESLRSGVAEQIERLEKDSIRLGIATDKLQGLERFAQINGAGPEELTKALGKMEISINKGVDAFDKLKLNAQELKNLKPEEAFLKIADALKAVGNQDERMADVKDIFGKGGASIMPTMHAGRRARSPRARTSTARSPEDQAALVEEANKATKELSFAFTDLKTMLVVTLIPAVTDLAKLITGLLKGDIGPKGAGLVTVAGETRGKAYDNASTYLKGMSDEDFKKFQHDFKEKDRGMQKGTDKSGESLSEFTMRRTGLGNTLFDYDNFNTAMYDRQDEMNKKVQQQHKDSGIGLSETEKWDKMGAQYKQRNDAFHMMFGMMNGSISQNVDQFAGQDDRKKLAEEDLKKLDKKESGILKGATHVTTSTALEKGTAAAFSQERRSSQQGQMLENAKKQLAELKGVRDQLKEIATTGLGKFPVVNLNGI